MATDLAIDPERINNFFNILDTRKSLLTTITHLHKTLTHHFSSLDQSLSHRSQTLDSQIQALDSQTQETLNSLRIREDAVPDRLSAAAARIERQKQAAISAAAGDGGGGGGGSLLLRKYCRNMDWKGLLGFVLAKKEETVGDREEGSALREEIAAAMAEESVDGMRMVLEAVEEFVDSRVEKTVVAVPVTDRRWSCGVLIQAVAEHGGGDRGGVGKGIKERAVGVLEKWKVVLGREKNGGFGAGEARMFLQIVIGFGLKEMIGEDFLRKLFFQFTTKRHIGQMTKLAMILGLGDPIKDIVEALAKSRKNAYIISKTGKCCTSAVEEANDVQLNATVAMIKSAEEKLESKSTIDSLWKRVQQLEKVKEEHKKKGATTSTTTSKPPNKRGRGGGGPSSYPPKSGRFSNASPTSWSPYNYASHMYMGPSPASYGPGYGAAAGARAGGSYAGQGSYAGPRNFGSYDRGDAPVPAPAPAYSPYHQ